jgi:hypothetical protein
MTPADDERRARAQAALAGLHAVLTEVASDVVSRIDERCPYRAREDRCTFAGGCRNQRREAGVNGGVQCTGDHQLRRTSR